MSILPSLPPRTNASPSDDGQPPVQPPTGRLPLTRIPLDQVPRALFSHCMTFLPLPDARAARRANRTVECLSRPRINPFLQFPQELLQHSMSFLGYRDLAMLGAADRRLKTFSKHPDALNPESLAAHCLNDGEPERVYQSPKIPVLDIFNQAATLQDIVGKHTLFILPHPRERAKAQEKELPTPPNVLQLINLQTHEELVFPLDRVIASCHSVDLPEPALIMIDSTGEVKKVTLAYLKRCGGMLDFVQVPTLMPSLGLDEHDFDWNSDEEFSTVAVEGSRVAIAYSNEIIVLDIADENFRLSLPFVKAHELKFYDKKLLCTSSTHCVLFSLTDPNQLCHFETHSHPGTSFRVAELFASKIAIGYRTRNVLWNTVGVGEVHDLATRERRDLLDRCGKRGDYSLNQLVGYGDRLFGASYTYTLWNGNNFNDVATTPDMAQIYESPIHTMIKMGDCLLSANNASVMIDSPTGVLKGKSVTKKLFDPWRPGRVMIISVKPIGQYLIVASGIKKFLEHKIEREQALQVFNLSQLSAPPTQAGPAPADPRESKNDD